jgi:hypothetical protein
MVAHRRGVGLRQRRSPIRTLAAVLPFVAAACSDFGLEDTSAPPEPTPSPSSDAGSPDMNADQAEGGSGTDDRDVRIDAATPPDAPSCTPTVIADDIEGNGWSPDAKWERITSGSGLIAPAPNPRPGGGTHSAHFVTSTGSSQARLGKAFEQSCTLRFDAWLYVLAHNSTNSRILSVTVKDGAPVVVLMGDGKLALFEGSTQRGSVTLPTAEWRRLVVTYTLTGVVKLALGQEELSVNLSARPATRLDFGLLGADTGSDDILFDDVVLEF